MIGMMQSRADNGGDGRREGVIKLSVSGFLHQADAKSAVNSNIFQLPVLPEAVLSQNFQGIFY